MGKFEVDPIHLVGRLDHPDYIHIDWFSKDVVDRTNALGNIPRFHVIDRMTHRTNVGTHSIKVPFFSYYMAEACLGMGIELDQPRIVYMGQHHDDEEIITGDIVSPDKLKATRAERRRMAKEEKKAIKSLEATTPKPVWLKSIEELRDEYKAQKTLEARIVNYFDKWDGYHEAVNEVICGENKGGFADVVKSYIPRIDLLNERNADWQNVVTDALGVDIFKTADPRDLQPRTLETANYTNAITFTQSLSDGNSESYRWWLIMNAAIFRTSFFETTLPGWKDMLPEKIKLAMHRASNKQIAEMVKDFYPDFDLSFDMDVFANTGLITPLPPEDEEEQFFADSFIVVHDVLMKIIHQDTTSKRQEKGINAAKGTYYSPNQR